LEELLAEPGLDCVHITTPNYLHKPMVEAAISAGKHIVCEKPLAMDSAEGAELLALAEKAGIVHATNFNFRFYPLCQEARSIVQEGKLGTIYQIYGRYVQDWLLKETDWNWRLEPDLGGDMRAVADIGSHWLDLTRFISGQDISEVCADFATFLPKRKKPLVPLETFAGKELQPDEYEERDIRTEDYASILLHFKDGARGVLTVSQVAAGRKNRNEFEINGANGSVSWNSERVEELWLGHRDKPSEVLLKDPSLMSAPGRAISETPGGHAEGFRDTFKMLYSRVYAAIEAGGPPAEPDYPTFADGVYALKLGEAILKSAQERRWVTVD
ncbi:MAG: Gfo/Idh/MocA family oxidoreductase, partial [Chloroflexota bacterium]|nr:Gfo/Idh/MocA family oxidoreductase [Chloroflexota bacterium]